MITQNTTDAPTIKTCGNEDVTSMREGWPLSHVTRQSNAHGETDIKNHPKIYLQQDHNYLNGFII